MGKFTEEMAEKDARIQQEWARIDEMCANAWGRLDAAEKSIMQQLCELLGIPEIPLQMHLGSKYLIAWSEYPETRFQHLFPPEEFNQKGHVRCLQITAYSTQRHSPLATEAERNALPAHRLADVSGESLELLFTLIGQLPYLVELDLRYNQWPELPLSFWNMLCRNNLVYLHLGDNHLEQLSPRIGEFQNLRWLDFGHNNLLEIPVEMGKLTHLEVLYLYGNSIKDLPSSFQQLINLYNLGLGGNLLTYLPECMRQLKKLKYIKVVQNDITNLPDWICELPEISDIQIERNRISKLSEVILHMEKLKEITLSPGWLDPFFRPMLKPEYESNDFGIIFPPNSHTGIMHRWREFIPTIIDKIKHEISLDAWETQYPYFPNHKEELIPICDQYPTATGKFVRSLIEK